jgi:hypothetical protein
MADAVALILLDKLVLQLGMAKPGWVCRRLDFGDVLSKVLAIKLLM